LSPVCCVPLINSFRLGYCEACSTLTHVGLAHVQVQIIKIVASPHMVMAEGGLSVTPVCRCGEVTVMRTIRTTRNQTTRLDSFLFFF